VPVLLLLVRIINGKVEEYGFKFLPEPGIAQTCGWLRLLSTSVPRFGSERDAERAVSMMNGHRVDNKNIIVSLL
jgi:hypothetical protein